MLRAVCLSFALGCGAAQAEGLNLSDQDRAAFRAEVRAAILADLEPIDRALNPPAPNLYSEEVAQDRARLDAQADLFAKTDRGYGAEDPRVTLVFFESYPCDTCADAWSELETLMARHPDLRVEPRFASDSASAQLLLSLLDHQGIATYRAARSVLLRAQTEDAVRQAIATGGWTQDRMLRPEPRRDASVFDLLELDAVPSYVLPDMMLRGSLPAIVLEKYVSN